MAKVIFNTCTHKMSFDLGENVYETEYYPFKGEYLAKENVRKFLLKIIADNEKRIKEERSSEGIARMYDRANHWDVRPAYLYELAFDLEASIKK